MATSLEDLRYDSPVMGNLRNIAASFARPLHILTAYQSPNFRADLMAGLTVAVILLPQSIAFALIAELPPQMGLFAAIIGAIIGALWGSSNQIHTGPTNAISLLVLSTLLSIATPGTAQYIVAAGMLALMAGLLQLILGTARLGVLVNFVSHSVVVGFSTGAGVLIAVNQLRHLLGLHFSSHNFVETIFSVITNLTALHGPTTAVALGTVALIVLVQAYNPKLPSALISMVAASAAVYLLALDQRGVQVIGQIPQSLPPLSDLPLLDLDLIASLSTGAFAVAAIGLVETTAIARSIAVQTGQRLDSNQEFVGQGLTNIAVGLFSGYPVAGSFSRSAVNFRAGAKTSVAAIFSGLFVLIGMFTLAPLAIYLPRAALAGVLIVTAFGMIDRKEIRRIARGARADALIMIVTFLGTLFLHLEFAVLAGILLSFAVYIVKSSVPHVASVVPDENFRHFVSQASKPFCPQLGILEIRGDLYFGAVNHVESVILQHANRHPTQRYLLLRMHNVNQCDFSGIHTLESVVKTYRERGGDVYFVRVRDSILALMKTTGFYDHVGSDHFLDEEIALEYLFYQVLDPAICIYESDVRVFRECQQLARPDHVVEIPLIEISDHTVEEIEPIDLWERLRQQEPMLVIDVREPREFRHAHIAGAQLLSLPKLLSNADELPRDKPIVLVCQSGRRSTRAAHFLRNNGYEQLLVLQGGMAEWRAQGLLRAVDGEGNQAH